MIEKRARILENPVYQKMPFYPYKDLLMWQEVEAQQQVNQGIHRNDYIYEQVRKAYKQLTLQQVKNFLAQNPSAQLEYLDDEAKPEEILGAIYGDGVTDADIEELRNNLLSRINAGFDRSKAGNPQTGSRPLYQDDRR